MSAPDLSALTHHDHPHRLTPAGCVRLGHAGRFLRRKGPCLENGRRLLDDLTRMTSLNHGCVLITGNGDEITVGAGKTTLTAALC